MRYRRILLKLSGEALEGDGSRAIDPRILTRVGGEIRDLIQSGVEIGIVIGGGNLFRGLSGAAEGMERTAADTMGMIATIMNCVALQDALVRLGQPATILSAIPVAQVSEPFTRRAALAALERGEVALLAGGTGNPYFTTDTAAALRALEISADVLLKATKVDGVYDKDPVRDSTAKRYSEIRYADVLEKRLGVMDAAAVALCRDNCLPLVVFNLGEQGNIKRVVLGEDVGTRVIE